MTTPLGRVTWREAGRTVVATLNGRDDWTVTIDGDPSEAQALALSALYARHYDGPQDGYYGQTILSDLAERMDGHFEWLQPTRVPSEHVVF